MPLLAIQVALAKIALSLQALLLIVAQIQAAPAKNAKLIPGVQQSLVTLSTTLQSLGTQLATVPATSTPKGTGTSPASAPVAVRAAAIPVVPFAELNTRARAAVVNILCTTTTNGPVKPISGSGVMIDPRGVILTNAHVAQLFLLKDYQGANSVNCIIRTGSPAEPAYKARLLYLSPAWIENNREVIKEAKPTGTGEDDFALLMVTSTIQGNPVAGPLPYLELDPTFNNPPIDDPVLLASYPAELTGGILVLKSLNEASAMTKIRRGYYFHDTHTDSLDLIDVGGSLLSQGGSSGGAVVEQNSGKLVGVIVTTTSGVATGERELFAITSSHIARRFREQSSLSLSDYLTTDLTTNANSFETNTAVRLRTILLQTLGM